MDLQIMKKDGTSLVLSDHDIFIDDFKVSSVPVNGIYGSPEGIAGRIDYGATYGDRTITVPFHLKAYDLLDYPLARDALFDLVLSTESFFIRELRRPKLLQYDFVDFTESAVDVSGKRKFSEGTENVGVGGKRYSVRVANQFDVEQLLESKTGEGEIVFETTELPFAESIGTSQDIEINGINSESGLWAFGMGFVSEDWTTKYTHVANDFKVYNPGVLVHPFMQDLKITISNVIGSTEYLQLRNNTNGTTFKVNEAVSDSKVIILDGPNITSNGLAYLRKTNRGFIEMAPKQNDFTMTGAVSAKVQFDFRFYYL